MDSDKEEDKMAVLALNEQYIIDEQAARKIVSTSLLNYLKAMSSTIFI
ncbi:hypothetical protein ACI2OX_21595 [Bacillus sp. N9]